MLRSDICYGAPAIFVVELPREKCRTLVIIEAPEVYDTKYSPGEQDLSEIPSKACGPLAWAFISPLQHRYGPPTKQGPIQHPWKRYCATKELVPHDCVARTLRVQNTKYKVYRVWDEYTS